MMNVISSHYKLLNHVLLVVLILFSWPVLSEIRLGWVPEEPLCTGSAR